MGNLRSDKIEEKDESNQTEPPRPSERPRHPLEKPSGTLGARLRTASRPPANGVRASTRTYPITAHRKCHRSRPPRVAWHIPPLLPSEKEARGSNKKSGESLTALLLRAEAKGLFLQNVAEAQRLELAHEGSRQKPTLLPSEKKARGSFKKPEELLTALLLRAEARELLLQKTPRPRDLGSRPRGARQSNPHARGANQKPGDL